MRCCLKFLKLKNNKENKYLGGTRKWPYGVTCPHFLTPLLPSGAALCGEKPGSNHHAFLSSCNDPARLCRKPRKLRVGDSLFLFTSPHPGPCGIETQPMEGKRSPKDSSKKALHQGVRAHEVCRWWTARDCLGQRARWQLKWP